MNSMWICNQEKQEAVSLFRKEFQLAELPLKSEICITAARWYRLKLNGVWLNDGPGRFLPEHTSFDRVKLHTLLHPGRNFIEVAAGEAMWAEIHLEYADGSKECIVSDENWQTSALPLEISDTAEYFDNRQSVPEFRQAAVLCAKEDGKWKNFRERDCRLMTRREFLLSGFAGQSRLDRTRGAALPGVSCDVSDAEALIYPDFDCSVIHPAGDCSIVLEYDAAEGSIGYWDFIVLAAEGTEIELQSGGRKVLFICREGMNRYTTYSRFTADKLQVTLRNMSRETAIQSIRLAESTYPAVKGMFQCSDYKLTRAWEVAERTLKLAMTDTFNDCLPWGEDCRYEILFALSSCGAYDLVRRTLRLGAEGMPAVTWVLALEDYCKHTLDKIFVREMWPHLRRILDGALQRLTPEGLAGSSLADSFYLAGALAAGARLSLISGDMEVSYAQEREKLLDAIASVWDSRFLAWPDTTEPGSGYSVTTNVLAVLFDAVPAELLPMARTNVLSPRPELSPPASAAEKMSRLMALEKLGGAGQIIPELLESCSQRLDEGATVFSTIGNAGEAMLLYFISRLTLGMQLQQDGSYELSVEPAGLTWARGNVMTPAGAVSVEWSFSAEKKLQISCHAPETVTVRPTTQS